MFSVQPPSTMKGLVQFPLTLILIHVTDAVSFITNPSERDTIKGFQTHVSTLQGNWHTISYMVRKQTRGPCKLLLQAHRPECCSSVLVWHYQAPLQNTEVVKWFLLQNVKDTSETNWRQLIHTKGTRCFYLKWVVLCLAGAVNVL